MLRLLSIELHKLKYNKSAKVISIVYFILISFIALIASIEFNFGSFHFRIADQGIFNFPFIWHFNTWVAAILKLFLAKVTKNRFLIISYQLISTIFKDYFSKLYYFKIYIV